ncbi:conserved exported hypothetical protein [Capnocytophaga canimorsus]|uniref:Uncharacterized protein n=1 Tax=Capnocytophaga canimorsus TaxID=28188 RepID=A0A0B7H7I2_9FLAO|nr:hypothetical protein [Capnocytophaga canimorsus]CEN35315.1 conserved exported hypothetical protein [Capnocytophaga canimorsus]
MNTFRFSKYALGLLMAALTLQSCIKDDNMIDLRPTAVVTVRPQADGSFFLQLDDGLTQNSEPPTQYRKISFWKQRGTGIGKLHQRK